jgi:hypothetical protein
MASISPFSFKNSKACAVYPLYIDTSSLTIKWLGSVAWRNPNDFNYSGFTPESPIDMEKTSTFSLGSFGGRREPHQTIFDCAFDETLQECGYYKLPELETALRKASFICRDLKGNYSREYSPDIEYACITFFIVIRHSINDYADNCTESAIETYKRQLNDGKSPVFSSEEELQRYKRNIESVIYKSVELGSILSKLEKKILPIIDVSDKVRVDPCGFPEADKRVGKGLTLNEVPLMPRVANTLIAASSIINELFTIDTWCAALLSIITSYKYYLDPIYSRIKELPQTHPYKNSCDKLQKELSDLQILISKLQTRDSDFQNFIKPFFSTLIKTCSLIKREDDFDQETISDLHSLVINKLQSVSKKSSNYQELLLTMITGLMNTTLPISFSNLKSYLDNIHCLQHPSTNEALDIVINKFRSFMSQHKMIFDVFQSISYGDDFSLVYRALNQYGYMTMNKLESTGLTVPKEISSQQSSRVKCAGIDIIRRNWPIDVTCPQCKSIIEVHKNDVYHVPRCVVGKTPMGPYHAVFDCPYRDRNNNLCGKQVTIPEIIITELKCGLPLNAFPCEEEFRYPIGYKREKERIAKEAEDEYWNY